MITREDIKPWMIEALKAQVIEVCKYIWDNYEHELRGSGNVLYTWQYDVRWAAQQLREDGFLKRIDGSRAKFWEIA